MLSPGFFEDKYVKELKKRIVKKEKIESKNEQRHEPATAISWEKFFMRMAKLSQERPGDYKGKAVEYFDQTITSEYHKLRNFQINSNKKNISKIN